jgi:hypothetical protein
MFLYLHDEDGAMIECCAELAQMTRAVYRLPDRHAVAGPHASGRRLTMGTAPVLADLWAGRRGFLASTVRSVCSVVCVVSDFRGGSYEVPV